MVNPEPRIVPLFFTQPATGTLHLGDHHAAWARDRHQCNCPWSLLLHNLPRIVLWPEARAAATL
jgi:hypothetical protein